MKHSGWWAAVGSTALMLLACGPARSDSADIGSSAQVVPIWPGQPPGTESWSGNEVELDTDLPAGKVHIVANVTTPTLTIVRPAPGTANGTAMIVVPGGAFRALAWDLEGTEVAQWLAARGVTAFVLKYRVRSPGANVQAAESFDAFFRRTQGARQIAVADAQQAVRYIRSNSRTLGTSLNRVGMVGFSAGAMTTMGAALAADAGSRPDFAVAVYGAMEAGKKLPPGAPPLFLVAAQDDQEVPARNSMEVYARWSAAGVPVELHLYERGGHGFGIRQRNLPVDKWPQALEVWLKSRGLLAR